ncbi:MAG TPA: hypothetical protein PK530_11770 [Anaerolineales bacterium]|nr:hypothetical protein [Anaerolineales bacterium]
MLFEVWLVEQQTRPDRIGEFACFWGKREMPTTIPKRYVDEHKRWAFLVSRVASPGHVAVFNAAWQEFLLARDALSDM